MSTPSRLASSVALPSARTLNPMMIASEADARLTLVSVTPPTPRSMTRSSTSSSIWMPSRASSSASTVPELSPLRIRFSWLVSFSAESRSSRLIRLRAAGGHGVALARAAPVGDLAGDAVLVDDQEVVTGAGHRREADDLDRPRRQRLLDVLAVFVDHPADAAVGVAGDHRVADPQRAALHQNGGHRPAAAVQVRLDRHTLGLHVGVGPQVQRGVGGQQHRLEQRLDVGALLGRDVDEHGVAAEVLGHQAVFGELRADLRRVGALLVNLVDRHHDWHVGGLRVVDGLHRLRHHAVVGGDHQDRDVGGLGAAGTHGGERLVARGVDEGDRPLRPVEVDADLVGADVLGDAAGLLLADVRLTDGVQQSGLAVVDVTHHGHHRRPGLAGLPRRPRPRRR